MQIRIRILDRSREKMDPDQIYIDKLLKKITQVLMLKEMNYYALCVC